MENQRNVTIIFNPHLSDKSPHKDESRPLPVCVTVSFTNLPTNLSGETLMRTFAGHLQRSWESAVSETRNGKRSGISPDNVSAVAAALRTGHIRVWWRSIRYLLTIGYDSRFHFVRRKL